MGGSGGLSVGGITPWLPQTTIDEQEERLRLLSQERGSLEATMAPLRMLVEHLEAQVSQLQSDKGELQERTPSILPGP